MEALQQERTERRERAADADGLHAIVDAFVEAPTLTERVNAWVALVRWSRYASDASDKRKLASRESLEANARLDAFLALVDDASERRRLGQATGALFAESDGTILFGYAGIPSERGFFAELGERVMNHLLPKLRDDRDLSNVLRRLFRSESDVNRLARMSDARFERLAALLVPADVPEATTGLLLSFANGFRLLATWVKAQGLSPKLRKRSRPVEITDSPFYRIARVSENLVERWLNGSPVAQEADLWRRESDDCRAEMIEINRRLERDGVSTHVVYGLEVIERCLERMALMVEIMVARSRAEVTGALHRLLVALATSLRNDRSVRHLIWQTTHLLQRRIVERSGHTGEHYVTVTRSEYKHMWVAAAGGGLLTVATAALKTKISATHTSDFVHGFLYGLNYAVTFVLMQHLGLVLATKQPAMTAAALATIIREERGIDRANDIAAFFARIVRSQLAATIGNVVVVAVGATLLVGLLRLIFGSPLLETSVAQHVYEDLSPSSSGTVFYAALTGVILWMGSVAGGWFDNLCAYHHVPEAIAQHPAGRYLGRERMKRWGDKLDENASGWATNVSLGFMLGMTPAFGHFFGVPLDVRHVTLNSGILALASASLGKRWFGDGMFSLALAGVAVMFVLNLSVSFFLSLHTAVRAYDLPLAGYKELTRALYRHFVNKPRDFFLPPRQ